MDSVPRPRLQFHGRSHEKGTDGGLWGPKQRGVSVFGDKGRPEQGGA